MFTETLEQCSGTTTVTIPWYIYDRKVTYIELHQLGNMAALVLVQYQVCSFKGRLLTITHFPDYNAFFKTGKGMLNQVNEWHLALHSQDSPADTNLTQTLLHCEWK